MTNFQGELHALYHATGNELFDHRSKVLGVGAIGMSRVGFGTAFADVDGDGWEDLIVAHGHVLRHPNGSTLQQTPVLFQNVPSPTGRAFKDTSDRGGPYFRTPAVARGLAVGDLDNDGRPDLVVSHTNGPVAVLRGEPLRQPWLGVKRIGKGNRDIVGSTATLEGETRTLTRFVKGGGSDFSVSDSRRLFGLASAGRVKRVTVNRRPAGRAETPHGGLRERRSRRRMVLSTSPHPSVEPCPNRGTTHTGQALTANRPTCQSSNASSWLRMPPHSCPRSSVVTRNG